MNKIFSSIYTFIFAGALFLGCTYWIYKNVRVNDLIGNSSVSPLTTQKGSKKELKLEIRNNDIVEVVSPDAVKLIIDGDKIENFESFSNLSISPDGKKMCFLVNTITPIWLYVANVDGSGIKQIDLAINCVWSPDSSKLAYNNHTTDVSNTDVYVYYLSTGKSKNLTKIPQAIESVRIYLKPEWVNNLKITSTYTDTKLSDFSKTTHSVEINVSEN